MKKKLAHSFLLLELLIALTLVILCVLPFISIPFNTLRKEIFSLQRIELQHIGDRNFSLIKERIYLKEISWEQIAATQEKKALVHQDLVSIPIKELAAQNYDMRCYLYSSGKKGQNNEEHRLITVEISFEKKPRTSNKKTKPLQFTYQLFVTKGLAKPQNQTATTPPNAEVEVKTDPAAAPIPKR